MRNAVAKGLLALAGVAAALLGLEVGLRVWPPVELPLNNPYQFTRLVGAYRFHVPLYTYREIYPVQFDHDGYYQRSDGAIDYHCDQLGGRWIAPSQRPLDGDVAVVAGDSFTFGFGLRYADAYVYRTEQILQENGRRRHFVNIAEPGADARVSLRNYLAVRDQQPHDLFLFGLHLNDLIEFPTSAVAMVGHGPIQPIGGSQLLAFVARTLAKRADRNAKIRELTDPAQLEKPRFRDNMAAIEAMQRAAEERGRRFAVVILPILVDLRAGTFEPVYAAVRRVLDARGIAYIDLSQALDGARDASLWILPFDQHPNERANALFANQLSAALLAGPLPTGSAVQAR
ncbi:MAG: SGNH/GDSL hydrolase family protein [Casimicrobiaceae bacterium]